MFIVKEKKSQHLKVYEKYFRTGLIWFNFAVFEF